MIKKATIKTFGSYGQPRRGGIVVVRAMKRNSSSVLVAVRKHRNNGDDNSPAFQGWVKVPAN
jgi:hypothetical protein